MLKRQEDDQVMKNDRLVLHIYYDVLNVLELVEKELEELCGLSSSFNLVGSFSEEKQAASPPSRAVDNVKAAVDSLRGIL